MKASYEEFRDWLIAFRISRDLPELQERTMRTCYTILCDFDKQFEEPGKEGAK